MGEQYLCLCNQIVCYLGLLFKHRWHKFCQSLSEEHIPKCRQKAGTRTKDTTQKLIYVTLDMGITNLRDLIYCNVKWGIANGWISTNGGAPSGGFATTGQDV